MCLSFVALIGVNEIGTDRPGDQFLLNTPSTQVFSQEISNGTFLLPGEQFKLRTEIGDQVSVAPLSEVSLIPPCWPILQARVNLVEMLIIIGELEVEKIGFPEFPCSFPIPPIRRLISGITEVPSDVGLAFSIWSRDAGCCWSVTYC